MAPWLGGATEIIDRDMAVAPLPWSFLHGLFTILPCLNCRATLIVYTPRRQRLLQCLAQVCVPVGRPKISLNYTKGHAEHPKSGGGSEALLIWMMTKNLARGLVHTSPWPFVHLSFVCVLPTTSTHSQPTTTPQPLPHRPSRILRSTSPSFGSRRLAFITPVSTSPASSIARFGYYFHSSAPPHKPPPPYTTDTMALPIYDADEPVPMTVRLWLGD